jgi:hypothetical protein
VVPTGVGAGVKLFGWLTVWQPFRSNNPDSNDILIVRIFKRPQFVKLGSVLAEIKAMTLNHYENRYRFDTTDARETA